MLLDVVFSVTPLVHFCSCIGLEQMGVIELGEHFLRFVGHEIQQFLSVLLLIAMHFALSRLVHLRRRFFTS